MGDVYKRQVQYLTAEGEVKEAAAAELDLRYRHSIFEENGGCILSAQFALTPGKPEVCLLYTSRCV